MPLFKKDKQAAEEKGPSFGKKFRNIFSSKDEKDVGGRAGALPAMHAAPQQSLNQYSGVLGYHFQGLPSTPSCPAGLPQTRKPGPYLNQTVYSPSSPYLVSAKGGGSGRDALSMRSISALFSALFSLSSRRYNGNRRPPGSIFREKSSSGVNLDGEAFLPNTGNAQDGGGGGPNLNRRYDFLPKSMVPFWYNKTPPAVLDGSERYLCKTCRHIDILALFKQKESTTMPVLREYIALGTLEKLAADQDCGLCGLIARIIAADTGVNLPKDLSDNARKEQHGEKPNIVLNEHESYYLCPIRFETTFNEPKLYVYSGKEMNDAVNYSTIQRPRGSMVIRPIGRMEPNLCRILLKPDQIDFGWIRERMKLCDERDLGKLDYQHRVNVRAIDV
jgi:hypothetical protein